MNKIVTILVVALFFLVSATHSQTSLTLSPSQVDGAPGEKVTVQLTATNFTDIVSMQFGVKWDPAVVQFDSVSGLNLKDLSAGNFNPDVSGGFLSFSWFEASTTGTSVNDGEAIFTMNFTVLGGTGTGSLISFESRSGLQIEVVNTTGEVTNSVTFNDSQFGDPNGNGGGGGTPSSPLISSISSASGTNGTMVCLDVKVSDFTDITQMQYSINWDANVLQFSEVRNMNLTGLAQASFGTTATNNGQLTVNWSNAGGTSVGDGTTIYQLCFNLVGAGGSSSAVSFSSTPTPISVTTTTSSNSVGITQTNGNVSITNTTTPPNGGNNLVNISTVNTTSGQTICVPITVNDFDDIASLQFSLQWNPSILEYTEIKGFNLPDLAASNFNATQATSGRVALAWFDNSAQGVSRSDGATIFEICFTVKGNNGTSTNISFSDNPTPREAATANNTINFTETNGAVIVGDGGPPPPPDSLNQLVNINTVTAEPGSTVCMPVTVHNFNGIASLQFSLEWNTSVLEFKEVTNFNLPDLAVSNFNTTGATNGQIALAWFDNTAQGVILQNGATAFEVCFEVKGTNGQSSNITFTDTPTAREAATANATINFTQTNGRVTVGEEVTPATSIINIGNTNASSGSSICIPVTAKDFDAIASMQFSLQWDANVLEFTGTQNFGLPDLSSASFNTTGANNGNISVTWFNQAGTGLTLQDNDTIFVLCYNVKGSSGSSTAITFTDTPTPRELATASGPITFTSTNGAVTVTGGPPPGDAILNIGDIQGEPGSTVCVPIVVKDFNTIASMQFSLGWDTNVLKFVETKNYNLKDLSNANLSTGNAENGQIAVAWFDQAAVGVTLPDGTTLLEICFEVVGTQGQSTTIQFTDVPTQRELATANGTIEFTSANGTFTVGGDPPPPTGKLVNIGTVNVTSGESFCTPITVNDFDAIASIQFSLGWDASVIEFTGVQSFGLQDLSAASFNTGGATNGAISVAWFDNSAQGVTLADGTTLFEACFTAVGANGTNTIIAFTDTPTQREASTSNATITFTQNNGTVNVGMGSCDPITVTSASTNVTCNGASNGTITVNAAGGDGSFTYQWSDASIGNTANATGLAPGTYTLTITSCGGQGTNESVSVTITEPPAIISVVTPEDASCFGTPDGRINISILGGTLPYTYTWSDTTLAPANRPVNALAGVYSLTITDGNDCEDVTNNIVISSPTQITGTVTTTPASCSGKPDGSATITPSGGSGSGYTYDWGDSSITGASPTNVPSGTHTVTITDGNNCTGTVAVTIGATVTITATAQVIEDACGNSKGGIQITPTGGASPYTYAWSGPATIGNTNTAENIPTGTYIVTITDNNDCSIVETIEVGGPVATLSTSATIDNVDCPGDTDGSITLTTAGGFGPYTYAWSNGATTDEIEDLSPGTYTVTITDSKVCTYEETFTVGTTSNLAVSVTINNGAPNASATAVVTGGVMPYEYEWCNGQTTPTATGLDQGICSVTIIDSLGCTVVENINITEDKPKPQILVSNPINCAGEKNGILQVQVADGKGPFNYAWNTGANSNILVNVGAGTYMVTVTDANNNMGVDTFQFGEPDSIKIVANSITAACMQDGGSIEITISGGTAPYKSIAWSNDIKDVLKLEGLRIGEYAVIVTDSSDCTAQRNFQINTDTSCVGCYTSNLVMTPNEDGLNDAFRLNCADNAPNNHLEIYNRWGQLVFEADNYQCVLGTESDCWKGKNRSGRIVDEGGYFWVFEFDDNNTRRRIRNHVTLLFED